MDNVDNFVNENDYHLYYSHIYTLWLIFINSLIDNGYHLVIDNDYH